MDHGSHYSKGSIELKINIPGNLVGKKLRLKVEVIDESRN